MFNYLSVECFTETPIKRPDNEKNDCTVRTFAYAMNTTYEKAHQFMEFVGRKPRKGVSMYRALTSHKEKIEKEFGHTLEEIEFRWNEDHRRTPTLRKLLKEIDAGMHIVIIGGHTFPIFENKVVDTNRFSDGCRARRVYKIKKL